MAIVEMSRMSLVAHQSEYSRLLKLFIKSGCVETIKSEQIEKTYYKSNVSQKEEIESKLLRIRFALGFLKDMVLQAKLMGKKIENINLKKENELLSLDDYENIAKEEYDLLKLYPISKK
jgi:hypothetical protein